MPPHPPTRSALEHMHLVVAARRYYLEGGTKSAIAAELGISRFKVARLLTDAVESGVVTIQIHALSDVDVDLSLRLTERFPLREALALNLPDGPEDFRREQLGRASAAVIAEVIQEGDVVGLAWGRTLHDLVHALPPLPYCTVVQVAGIVPTTDLRVSALDLARTMAARAGGEVHALHVPMLLDSGDTATRLRTDPFVEETAALFDRLDRAVISIGGWAVEGQSALRAALGEDTRRRMIQAGAVADVCTIVLDDRGREVLPGELAERSIAISAEQLRRVPDVTAVAGGGVERAPAIAAALRSGLVHRLLIDDATARALVHLP